MASNHVSCRYPQLTEPKSVRAADEPSRSRGNDSLRWALLRIIGAFCSLDVGDEAVPLTLRRSRRPPDPKDLRSTRTEPAFPVASLTDHGFHGPERLPPSRALSDRARSGPYRPTSEHRHSSRKDPKTPSLASFFSRGFHRRELRRQASLDSFCSFQITRPATTSAASGPPTRSRAPG